MPLYTFRTTHIRASLSSSSDRLVPPDCHPATGGGGPREFHQHHYGTGLVHYQFFSWKSPEVSMEVSIASMEASITSVEAGFTSMEVVE